MKIENQVTSLELSKRLKELGVKQESLWNWAHCEVVTEGASALETTLVITMHKGDKFIASAFTVAELGEMLPSPAGNYLGRKRFKCGWDENGWYIELLALNGGTNIFHGKSEADSRANMLIYLIENQIIHAVEL